MDLQVLFNSRYHLKDLKVDRDLFLKKLKEYAVNQGSWMVPNVDFTETKRWGHNHDFGDGIVVNGTMENRHLRIMQRFLAQGLPENLSGKRVLVIGCYTGGDALLLAALGATVSAIEEVTYYAEITNWLATSFGANITVFNKSIDKQDVLTLFSESFDFIYNAGVIYHLRNIIYGLENCACFLKSGSTMFLETMITEGIKGRNILEYHGSSMAGYNWFLPNIEATQRILHDVGFDSRLINTEPNARASFVCTKR